MAEDQERKPTFGDMFGSLQSRLGMEDDDLGRRLGVMGSTIAGIKNGERGALRAGWFWARLQSVKGVTEGDYNNLLVSAFTPRHLEPTMTVTTEEGVIIPIYTPPSMEIDKQVLEVEIRSLLANRHSVLDTESI